MRYIKAVTLLFFSWILFVNVSARTFTYSDSCAGNDGKFTIDDVSGITTYLWDFGDPASGASNTSTLQSPTHSFTNNGDFNVKLTINGGSEVVNNTIHITYKFTGSSATAYFCRGSVITLDPDTSKKAKHYQWVNGETTQQITIKLTQDSVFYAWMYDIHECRAKSIFNLKVLTLKLDFSVNQPKQCLNGNNFVFTNNTNTTKRPWIRFDWDYGDLYSDNDSRDGSHSYTSAGTYFVRLTSTPVGPTGDTTACIDTLTKRVSLFDQVPPDFEYQVFRCENLISFHNTSGPAQNYYWDFGNGEKHYLKDTSERYPGTGTYTIKLYTNKNTACSDSISKDIEITLADSLIFIPNSFSPNNDGLNDSFKVYGLDFDCFSYKLHIYNRWGVMVFNSEEMIGEPIWTGRHKAVRVPQGVYYYSIIGKHFSRFGSLTVLP